MSFDRVISQIGIAALFSLNPDLLRATGVCLHMDLFASVRGYDLERGGPIIHAPRLELGFGREGISDGLAPAHLSRKRFGIVYFGTPHPNRRLRGAGPQVVDREVSAGN